MLISNNDTYIGTRLKYIVEIGAAGFSMEDDSFTVDIIRGTNAIHFDKVDMETDDEGHWFVCFDTLALGVGLVTAKITAYVPDTDYADGIRVEVQKIDLVNIKA